MNMGTETESNNVRRLTVEDPVGKDILDKLGELDAARGDVASKLLDQELERVRLLAIARKIDDEKQRVFQKFLIERGLPPHTSALVDAKSGKITVLPDDTPAQAQAPAPPPS